MAAWKAVVAIRSPDHRSDGVCGLLYFRRLGFSCRRPGPDQGMGCEGLLDDKGTSSCSQQPRVGASCHCFRSAGAASVEDMLMPVGVECRLSV